MPGQLLTVPYTAVQFVALQQCRALARQYGLADSPRWSSAVPFVSGALAGAQLLTSALALLPALAGQALGTALRGRLSEVMFKRVFFAGLLLLGTGIALRG